MNKNKITQNQYIFIIIASMVGIGILSLPTNISKIAHQNGWISTFISGIYPIFIVITASIIDKKTVHADFWDINNKIYGKTLSYIFTFIFFFYFLTIFSAVIAGYTNILNTTIATFLPPIFVVFPTLLIVTLISMSGIYMIGRICELYFYFSIPLIVIPLFFIGKGSLFNIQPFFSPYTEIIKAIPNTFLTYTLVEICYIIISKISNRKNTKKAGIIACVVTIFIYTFFISFIAIYYLGWELTSKLEVPIIYMIETLRVPLISNFKALFIFLWSEIVFKHLLCDSFVLSYCLSKLLKMSYKKACIISSVITLAYTFLMIPEYNRKMIIDFFVHYFVIFSVTWGLATTILVSIRYRGEKDEHV
ncbi:GerAB/ArcD/ProY family transporter [Clostridium ganghwense]|uniref:GerAB/ArcD/ProY family transporter n=1 Tax=Clostridium ganghwense TaxID=312089 RepID=A0ABT4CQJ3_9CLOT|nr:GerAB/ArcD/ProY family transporter [Clostridium ganghwense]MCY6370723.1 GerAB/ArcD/ProY family transporter [Clostridium ganghwense]